MPNPEHPMMIIFRSVINMRGSIYIYLESTGLTGLDGWKQGIKLSTPMNIEKWPKTHIASLEYPIAFSILIDLQMS